MIQIFKNNMVSACIYLLSAVTAQAQTIFSPDGNIKLDFQLENDGVPAYKVSYKSQPVVKTSHLGFELRDAENLMDGFSIISTETDSFDETWQPVWGESRDIRNHYNELLVKLDQTKTDRRMNIRFRVYDDGVGLRYEFPQEGRLNYFVVKEEHTQFAMTGNHTAWWIPGDYDTQEPKNYNNNQVHEIYLLHLQKNTDNGKTLYHIISITGICMHSVCTKSGDALW